MTLYVRQKLNTTVKANRLYVRMKVSTTAKVNILYVYVDFYVKKLPVIVFPW